MYVQTAVNEADLNLQTVDESLIQQTQLSIANQSESSGHATAVSQSHTINQQTEESDLLQAAAQSLVDNNQLQTHTELETTE